MRPFFLHFQRPSRAPSPDRDLPSVLDGAIGVCGREMRSGAEDDPEARREERSWDLGGQKLRATWTVIAATGVRDQRFPNEPEIPQLLFRIDGDLPWLWMKDLWDSLATRLSPLGYADVSLEGIRARELRQAFLERKDGAAVRAIEVRKESFLFSRLRQHTGTVDLSQVPFLDVSSILFEVPRPGQVEVLKLPHDDLSTLPPSVGRFTALRELHLEGNLLQDVPSWLGQCAPLRLLGLHGNPLTAFPAILNRIRGFFPEETRVLV